MNRNRGAVNIEYIILIVVGALAVVLGLGYLSTVMNDKHTNVAGSLSESEVANAGITALSGESGGSIPDPWGANIVRVMEFDGVTEHILSEHVISDPTGNNRGLVFKPDFSTDTGCAFAFQDNRVTLLEAGKTYRVTYDVWGDGGLTAGMDIDIWSQSPGWVSDRVADYAVTEFAHDSQWRTFTFDFTCANTHNNDVGIYLTYMWNSNPNIYMDNITFTEIP